MGERKDIARALARQDVVEASIRVRTVCEPRPPNENDKACIARAADRLGWPYSRVREIWYRNARSIKAWEMDALRSWVGLPD